MTIFVFYPPEKGDEGGFVLLEGDDRRVWHSFPFCDGWHVVTEWMHSMYKIFSPDFKYKGSLIPRDDKGKKVNLEE